MKRLDRYCILMFDEVSLRPGIHYNQKGDFIEGFVDLGGNERRALFADHATVFMLKGIHRKWKQPICFCYCEFTMKTPDLVVMIKVLLSHIFQCGLTVVATVSDQGATNAAAIKQLLKETNENCVKSNIENKFLGYIIDNKEIVHIFDCPHLLKGIRNVLLTKDLIFTHDGKKKVASWKHIISTYKLDKLDGRFSTFTKLTDEHVFPEKIRKMKVKHCAQVFSFTVAVAIRNKAKYSQKLSDPNHPEYLDPAAHDTADLLLFFDELFDSVNGHTLYSPIKKLRCVVSNKSHHMRFWQDAIAVIRSMSFVDAKTKRSVVTPSLSNWVSTLQNFMYIWKRLRSEGFRFIAPRDFNQDPLENFFSCIRSHGVRNTNPTCASFTMSSKSLIINNLVSSHSLGANCEKDDSVGALSTLKSFILQKIDCGQTLALVRSPIYAPLSDSRHSTLHDTASAYVAGYVMRKIYQRVQCTDCKIEMEAAIELEPNELIRLKMYEGCQLFEPSIKAIHCFDQLATQLFTVLPQVITKYNLKSCVHDRVQYDAGLLFCDVHRIVNNELFFNITLNIVLHYYIKIINNILCGKVLSYKNLDSLTDLAYKKFLKIRKK
ncbi:hypothetical protein PPYR_12849 [Photinus pyralis]|uniref:THAP-type domain-containing protein n=1 Tax=Photinus pyralis TaxID=7054 RepID=A0A5N4A7G8_PHOPY|nr:hypothetical protein PPYR_12849 [Photinus pyralis]